MVRSGGRTLKEITNCETYLDNKPLFFNKQSLEFYKNQMNSFPAAITLKSNSYPYSISGRGKVRCRKLRQALLSIYIILILKSGWSFVSPRPTTIHACSSFSTKYLLSFKIIKIVQFEVSEVSLNFDEQCQGFHVFDIGRFRWIFLSSWHQFHGGRCSVSATIWGRMQNLSRSR